ncbi:hypothetical protein [uncultured Brevundimonas sp.]|uniref:hypothetical protein n=1 Tax=uncultured Brevundimonas sp. TaxID=213418 RepID=UPI002615CA62|nr:hypothetical protein [uncultured Brevundimonas sp.]
MSVRIALAAAVITFAATPALAFQEAPAAVAPAETISEAEMEALGEAFEARMETLKEELSAAIEAAGTDANKLSSDVDGILARYQPEIEAFTGKLDLFFAGQIAAQQDETVRSQLETARTVTNNTLRGLPAQIKASTLAAAAQNAAD